MRNSRGVALIPLALVLIERNKIGIITNKVASSRPSERLATICVDYIAKIGLYSCTPLWVTVTLGRSGDAKPHTRLDLTYTAEFRCSGGMHLVCN